MGDKDRLVTALLALSSVGLMSRCPFGSEQFVDTVLEVVSWAWAQEDSKFSAVTQFVRRA